MVRFYGRKNCRPSCMIKVDLRKAYDTMEWGFIEEMLVALAFPLQFVQLVMICIKTLSYSLMINGEMNGFFQAKRGLRQGDPMSPLLFALGMEYLTRLLREVGNRKAFQFHDRCGKLELNHLCFADDLILFCHGDFVSILLMLQALKLFFATSGLVPNEEKSALYCSGMADSDVQRVLEVSKLKRSQLPFRYLGIPIYSKRLPAAEGKQILAKMMKRIKVWGTQNLSYMARLILVNSVLLSIQSYWAQILILPKRLLKEVESICRSFMKAQDLWHGQNCAQQKVKEDKG